MYLCRNITPLTVPTSYKPDNLQVYTSTTTLPSNDIVYCMHNIMHVIIVFHSALAPTVELGSHWPPQGIDALSPYEIPLLNTIILLSSGAAVTYAHHSLIQGNRRGTILGIVVTVLLAAVFTALQGVEYLNAGFTIADGAYGSTFYMATGFHGLHVLIGTLFIGVAFFRVLSYQLTDHHHLGFESSILYWHFVDVVWLFLYVSIYWWGS